MIVNPKESQHKKHWQAEGALTVTVSTEQWTGQRFIGKEWETVPIKMKYKCDGAEK